MDLSLDQTSPIRRFLRTWRRELIRGGVLFTVVIAAGLFIRSASRGIRDHMPSALGALGSFGDFDWGDGEGGNLFGRGRQVGDPWEYRNTIKPSQHVWIRNTNGPIEVVAGTGEWLEVRAEKSWRRSSPGSVELVAVPSERGVTICAMWEARERTCGEAGDYRMNGVRKNDVAVRFHVMLPKGVPVEASTVNGALDINGVTSPVEAATVNGRIIVSTASGPINATTVNGSIEAEMQSLTGGDVKLVTVNGSVRAGLPPRLNANIDAETVNGRVESDIPVKIMGKISTRRLRGTIGEGGPTLKFMTVNGSISLHEASPHPAAAPCAKPGAACAPHPARAPAAARTHRPPRQADAPKPPTP